MKPGDLVTLSRHLNQAWNSAHGWTVTSIGIHDAPDADASRRWNHGETGILLEDEDGAGMVQILHDGHVGWALKAYLEVISEPG